MVSLKLSQPGLFGPPQLEEPAAGGIGIWPVQVTVGLLWETVPLEGVAASAMAAKNIRARTKPVNAGRIAVVFIFHLSGFFLAATAETPNQLGNRW